MSGLAGFWSKYKTLLVAVPALVALHYGWYNLQYNEDFVPKDQRPKKVGTIPFSSEAKE